MTKECRFRSHAVYQVLIKDVRTLVRKPRRLGKVSNNCFLCHEPQTMTVFGTQYSTQGPGVDECLLTELTEVEVPQEVHSRGGQLPGGSWLSPYPPRLRKSLQSPGFPALYGYGRQDDESPLSENDGPDPQMSVEQTNKRGLGIVLLSHVIFSALRRN